MIKANELRIGNLFHPINRRREIHLPSSFIIIQIATIGLFKSEYFKIGESHDQEGSRTISHTDLSPIRLTEDWFHNLGFTLDYKEHQYLKYRKAEVELWGDFQNGFFLLNGKNMTNWSRTYKYVHELQNLFFALTGEDLTL